jgi:hypothetical protein
MKRKIRSKEKEEWREGKKEDSRNREHTRKEMNK